MRKQKGSKPYNADDKNKQTKNNIMKTLENNNNGVELLVDNYLQYYVYVNFVNGSSSICLYAGLSKIKAYKAYNQQCSK